MRESKFQVLLECFLSINVLLLPRAGTSKCRRDSNICSTNSNASRALMSPGKKGCSQCLFSFIFQLATCRTVLKIIPKSYELGNREWLASHMKLGPKGVSLTVNSTRHCKQGQNCFAMTYVVAVSHRNGRTGCQTGYSSVSLNYVFAFLLEKNMLGWR